MAPENKSHHIINISSIVDYTESGVQTSSLSSSIIIPMTPVPNLSSSSTWSSEDIHSADNPNEYSYVRTRKSILAKQLSMGTLIDRMCTREVFYARLALVSNLTCFLGILGIVLMMVANELTFKYTDNHDTETTWFIKLAITITTIFLVIFIFYYHYLHMKLYNFQNTLAHWYVRLTPAKIFLIMIELFICTIHPIPRSHPQVDSEMQNLNSTVSDPSLPIEHSMSYIAIDVGLGLPMFLRLYLLGRAMMFSSHLFRHVSLRSFGYLNRVSIDFYFLMKTYIEQWPVQFFFAIYTLVFLIGSWSLRACDYTKQGEHMSMFDAMWLFVITSTSIGYGDQIPSTSCGRIIAAIIGLVGLLLSALLISVLAIKLILTREEKYLHTFVSDIELAKKCEHQAATIIKLAIKVWYLKRKNKSKSIGFFQAQRKLFQSIHYFQRIKHMRRNLVDHCIGFRELMIMQRNTNVETTETRKQMMANKTKMKKVEEHLSNISDRMDTLQCTLNTFLNRISNENTKYIV